MIVRVNGVLLSNVAEVEEVASKSWVAQQMSEIMNQVGESIANSIYAMADKIISWITNGIIELATVGAVAFFVFYCYRLMFGKSDEKTYNGMFFSAVVYIICVIVGVNR